MNQPIAKFDNGDLSFKIVKSPTDDYVFIVWNKGKKVVKIKSFKTNRVSDFIKKSVLLEGYSGFVQSGYYKTVRVWDSLRGAG